MDQNISNTFNRDFIYTCPSKVFEDNSLTINELKIYMLIRSFMDTTGLAYPSNNWIANHIGISTRKTIDNINKLVAKGYIERLTVNGRRYLRIPTRLIEEQTDKVLLVSPATPPSDAKVTPPHDAKVTLLDQTLITSKNNYNNNARDDKKNKKIIPVEYPETYYPTKPDKKEKKELAKMNATELMQDNPHNIPKQMIDDWVSNRASSKKPITKTVWNRLNKELSKCENPIEALEEAICKGWIGFDSKWVSQNKHQASQESYYDNDSYPRINRTERLF